MTNEAGEREKVLWAMQRVNYACATAQSHLIAFGRHQIAHELTLAVESLRAALSATPEGAAVVGWRPIESAPKEADSLLLGWSEGAVRFILRVRRGGDWEYPGGFAANPTHWQPLPLTPSSALPDPTTEGGV